MLADTDADIIAVCDVMSSQAVSTFESLVQQVGRLMLGHDGKSCLLPGSRGDLLPVFQEGWRGRGVGLMWRKDRVRPVPGSLRRHNEDPLYRAMVLADFIVTVFRSRWHRRSSLRGPRRGRTICWWPQRDAVEELGDWGLFDPVAHIGAEGYATVGHWRGDAIGRVDGPLVSRSVADATTAVASVNNAMTRKASTHLPVVLDVAMDTLKAQVARRPSRLDGDGYRALRAVLGKAG